jgi:pimeloyl-ACP methyl ester carboxylesterase
MNKSKSIVFIHGLFMNPKSWTEWKKYFESKGYTCYAPAYPFHEGETVSLRKEINKGLAKLRFSDVMESLISFIDKLPEKPIVIGHSMGGLAVQKLLNIDKVAAGIAIDSAPPKGVLHISWSFIKANLPVVNPFKGNSPFQPHIKWWHYAFCNTMSSTEAAKYFEQFVVPESRNIPRSGTGKEGSIDFKKPHNPLLFIAGEKDHIVPASLNKKNFKAYRDLNSKREFKEFAGRTHFICGQENWQEVAEFINTWINKNNG